MRRRNVRCEGDRVGSPRHEPLEGDLQILKPRPILNPGWKKANLDTLREIYLEMVVPGLERSDRDQRWFGWRRAQYILEIELWETDCKEAADSNLSEEASTREDFWGCLRFPHCRECLPLNFAGQPMAVMQKVHAEKVIAKEKSKAKGYTDPVQPKAKANFAAPSESTESWSAVDADAEDLKDMKKVNMNLTMEEVEEIMKKRRETDTKRKPRAKASEECMSPRLMNGSSDAEDDLREARKSTGKVWNFSVGNSPAPKPSRSPDETRRLIQEGNARRKAMRKRSCAEVVGGHQTDLAYCFCDFSCVCFVFEWENS